MNDDYLKEQIELADKAAGVLRYSYENIADALPLNEVLDDDVLVNLDALTSRFARLADILTQKVFRALDAIELIDEGTLIDRLNRAEKRGIIESAAQWREIRLLKNQIAHDYVLSDLREIFSQTIAFCPVVFQALNKVNDYISKSNAT